MPCASDRQRTALALNGVDERDTTVLIDAFLREDEPNSAGALLWSLARKGDAAVPALADALDSDQAQRRHRALEALVKIGTPRSLATVAARTGHADLRVHARATITAGMSGDVSVIAALVALVASGDLDVEAGDALHALATDDATTKVIARKSSEAIAGADNDGRRRLAGMLAPLPSVDIDSTLHALAADTDPSVAISARPPLRTIGTVSTLTRASVRKTRCVDSLSSSHARDEFSAGRLTSIQGAQVSCTGSATSLCAARSRRNGCHISDI